MGEDRWVLIGELAEERGGWESGALLSALVWTLHPEEVCGALDFTRPLPWRLRHRLVHRVVRDITDAGIKDYHIELVERCLGIYYQLPSRYRQGCGYCLEKFWHVVPELLRFEIMRFFLGNRHRDMRLRGYKLLRKNWLINYEGLVESAWTEFQDPEAASIIARNWPVSSAIERLHELMPFLDPWDVAYLFLRAEDVMPGSSERLREIDEISYIYVRAKVGKPLRSREAWDVFRRNRHDERVGLLIWSFGQMQLTEVLMRIAAQRQEVFEEKRALFLARGRDGDGPHEIPQWITDDVRHQMGQLGMESGRVSKGDSDP